MKTQNADIYHCQHCGHIVFQPPEQCPPQCCGEPMPKAASHPRPVTPEEPDLPTTSPPAPAS